MVRRTAAGGLVDEIDNVALFQKPGCPAFATIGRVEPILALN